MPATLIYQKHETIGEEEDAAKSADRAGQRTLRLRVGGAQSGDSGGGSHCGNSELANNQPFKSNNTPGHPTHESKRNERMEKAGHCRAMEKPSGGKPSWIRDRKGRPAGGLVKRWTQPRQWRRLNKATARGERRRDPKRPLGDHKVRRTGAEANPR